MPTLERQKLSFIKWIRKLAKTQNYENNHTESSEENVARPRCAEVSCHDSRMCVGDATLVSELLLRKLLSA